MARITFLGTGGGRFMTVFQRLSTGGFRISSRGVIMGVDPGPGAILRTKELGMDPTKSNSLFVSHCHPDHYTDAEVMIEGMTQGGMRKMGTLVGSESVIKGADGFEKPISDYHLSKPEKVVTMKGGERHALNEWCSLEATKTLHSDPSAVGFMLKTPDGIIGYTSDTQLFDGLAQQYKGAKVLILNVIRPLERRIQWHLCTEDAAKIIAEVKPKLAVLTHFGIAMYNENPSKQCEWISKQIGINTIAAKDGMSIYVEDEIEIKMNPTVGGAAPEEPIPPANLPEKA